MNLAQQRRCAAAGEQESTVTAQALDLALIAMLLLALIELLGEERLALGRAAA
jgi:hypothetical protein